MENRPIPVNVATAMMAEYVNYLKQAGINPDKQTQSISFTGKELMDWLVQTMPFADELRICMGVYPKGEPAEGRITAILWPYKNGQPATQAFSEGKDGNPPPPIPPYNQGGLQP